MVKKFSLLLVSLILLISCQQLIEGAPCREEGLRKVFGTRLPSLYACEDGKWSRLGLYLEEKSKQLTPEFTKTGIPITKLYGSEELSTSLLADVFSPEHGKIMFVSEDKKSAGTAMLSACEKVSGIQQVELTILSFPKLSESDVQALSLIDIPFAECPEDMLLGEDGYCYSFCIPGFEYNPEQELCIPKPITTQPVQMPEPLQQLITPQPTLTKPAEPIIPSQMLLQPSLPAIYRTPSRPRQQAEQVLQQQIPIALDLPISIAEPSPPLLEPTADLCMDDQGNIVPCPEFLLIEPIPPSQPCGPNEVLVQYGSQIVCLPKTTVIGTPAPLPATPGLITGMQTAEEREQFPLDILNPFNDELRCSVSSYNTGCSIVGNKCTVGATGKSGICLPVAKKLADKIIPDITEGGDLKCDCFSEQKTSPAPPEESPDVLTCSDRSSDPCVGYSAYVTRCSVDPPTICAPTGESEYSKRFGYRQICRCKSYSEIISQPSPAVERIAMAGEPLSLYEPFTCPSRNELKQTISFNIADENFNSALNECEKRIGDRGFFLKNECELERSCKDQCKKQPADSVYVADATYEELDSGVKKVICSYAFPCNCAIQEQAVVEEPEDEQASLIESADEEQVNYCCTDQESRAGNYVIERRSINPLICFEPPELVEDICDVGPTLRHSLEKRTASKQCIYTYACIGNKVLKYCGEEAVRTAPYRNSPNKILIEAECGEKTGLLHPAEKLIALANTIISQQTAKNYFAIIPAVTVQIDEKCWEKKKSGNLFKHP